MVLPSALRLASLVSAGMIAVLALATTAVAQDGSSRPGDPAEVRLRTELHQPAGGELTPPLPDPVDFPLQLVLDDDSAESNFGLVGAESVPFMWFNRFTETAPFAVEQMWVLFPQEPLLDGADVQLAVYQDPDGDPTNGAELIATYDVTVQANDGETFSVYELVPPAEITAGDAYLGVVSRYAESPTPPTFPATLDTDDSQGRSWVAVWTGGPPSQPELPGDDETFVIDTFLPGNWMIRGFGRSTVSLLEIPTLDGAGLALLVLLMAGTGAVLLARRPRTAYQPADKRDEVA